jgi:hypothetical protein
MVEQSSMNPTCLPSSHVTCMACKDTNRSIKPHAELSTSVLGLPFSSVLSMYSRYSVAVHKPYASHKQTSANNECDLSVLVDIYSLICAINKLVSLALRF